MKTGYNSKELYGPMLADLLENYVSVINSSESPVLNLRVSFFTVAENAIQSVITKLQKEYYHYMDKQLMGKLPIEQGDIEALKQFHTEIIDDTIIVQNKCEFTETTLFAIHKQKYFKLAQKLGSELLEWISPVTSEDNDKCKKFLTEFQDYIIEFEGNNIKGGHLQRFLEKNERKSKEMCEKLTEAIYFAQAANVSLKQLQHEYYVQAIGPAKVEVFNNFTSNIPGPPQHVNLLSATGTTLEIQWKAPIMNPHAAQDYQINFYQEGENVDQVSLITVQGTKTFKPKNKLQPKTNYFIKIRGRNFRKYAGEFCEPVMFQTKAGKPDKATKPSITPISDTQGELKVEMLPISKQNGSLVTSIIVNRKSELHRWKEILTSPVKGEQQDQITLLVDIRCTKDDKRLYFQVQFKNEAGLSEPSIIVFDIKDMIPGVPEITDLVCKPRQIEVKWNRPSNSWAVKSYLIYYRMTRGDSASTEWEKIKVPEDHGKQDLAKTLPKLSPKTKYSIRLCAMNANKQYTAYCTKDAETKAGIPNKPQKVESLRVISATKGALSFQKPTLDDGNGSPVNCVVLEKYTGRKWENDKEFPIAPIHEHSNTIDIEVDLVNVTGKMSTLSYRLRTQNEVGLSEPSKVFKLDIKDMMPSVPEITVLDCKPKEIQVTWNQPINSWVVKSYCIEYSRIGEDNTQGTWEAKTVNVDHRQESNRVLTCTLRELFPKTKYSIRICAKSTKDKCTAYCLRDAETRADKPTTPQIEKSFKVISATKGKISIVKPTLDDGNGSIINCVVLERKTNAKWEKDKEIPMTPIQEDSKVFDIEVDLINFTEEISSVVYRVRTKNEVGLSDPSAVVELDIEEVIPGVPEITQVVCNPKEIQLKWNRPILNPMAVKSYHIEYRKDNAQSDWEETKTVVENHREHDRKFTLNRLSPKTRYSIRLCARNANHRHIDFYSKDVETPADKPSKPQIAEQIRVISETKGMINILKPTSDEENGSKVFRFRLERNIGRKWEKDKEVPVTSAQEYSDTIPLEVDLLNYTEDTIPLEVDLLNYTEDTIPLEVDLLNYTEEVASLEVQYRVRMENKVGLSEPSTVMKLLPDQIIPAKPENLRETEVTGNSIAVSWQKPDINPGLVNKYHVCFKEKSKDTWNVTETNTLKAEIENLKPKTKYQFTVQAYTGKMASKKSDVLLKETLPTVPPIPETPVVIPQGKEFLLKFYLPPISESGCKVTHAYVYHFDRNREKYRDPTKFKISSDTEQSCNEKTEYERTMEINTCKTFWITITLWNTVGQSKESMFSGVAMEDVTPGKPDNLKCKLIKAREVELSWNVPKVNGHAAKIYKIFVKKSGGVETEWKRREHCYTLKSELLYEATIDSLEPFTRYDFRVQSLNNVGENINAGGEELISVQTKKAPPDQPSRPSVELIPGRPLVAKVMFSLLKVSQMNGSIVTQAKIECKSNNSLLAASPKVAQLNSNVSLEELKERELEEAERRELVEQGETIEVEMPNLTNVNVFVYKFTVKLINDIGESEPSQEFPLPILQLQPGIPQDLDISDVTTHSMKVTWKQPNENPILVRGYKIEYDDPWMANNPPVTVGSEIHEHIIKRLKSNHQYNIKVSATATVCSLPSKKKKATLPARPSAPTALCVEKIEDTSVKIRWKTPRINSHEVLYFKVELKENLSNGRIQTVGTRRTAGHSRSAVFHTLESRRSYTISVSSYNDHKETHNATAVVDFNTYRMTTFRWKVVGYVKKGIEGGESHPIEESDEEYDESYHLPKYFD